MAALCLVTLLAGCSLFRHDPKRGSAAAPPRPLVVGIITLVNESEHFVLIDTDVLAAPSAGALLQTWAEGRQTGELTASAVQRRPFVIADIRQGNPRKGDRVVMMPILAARSTVVPPLAAVAPRPWYLRMFGRLLP